MIPRTVLEYVERSMTLYPVVLITGARQVGKTTLCRLIAEKHGYDYVSLADVSARRTAQTDPEFFLASHRTPLIIDEVQYVPSLFDHIEAAVDRRKFDTGANEGMYILTGSQAYNLMQDVTQSMAGRVAVVEMSPLSVSEVLGREEVPFTADARVCAERCRRNPLTQEEVYRMAVRGMYPRLYERSDLTSEEFYSNYVSSYIERDVTQIVNVTNKLKFLEFMEMMASLTGQELVYDRVSSLVGIDIKTVQAWTSVLVAGGIVRLMRPYVERSNVKRLANRPKLYFCDTGLACYLARILDPESLRAGYMRGPVIETFIVNEIVKSYSNTSKSAAFYYYRDSRQNEIDLIIHRNGRLHLVECKSGATYDAGDVKAFSRLEGSEFEVGDSCIVCLAEEPYPIREGVYALPVSSI